MFVFISKVDWGSDEHALSFADDQLNQSYILQQQLFKMSFLIDHKVEAILWESFIK